MPMRIQTRYFGVQTFEDDEHVRTYHTRLELLEGYSQMGMARGTNPASIEFQPSPVLDIVLSIPGVTVAHLQAYSISVRKSPLYSWDEIEPRMLELMNGVELAKDDSAWVIPRISEK